MAARMPFSVNSGFFRSGIINRSATKSTPSIQRVIVALCELDIPLEDSRFVKNGNTMLDNLMTYYQKGAGFLHTKDGSGSNQMATEQGFYALVAVQRARQDRNSLYRMGDASQSGVQP